MLLLYTFPFPGDYKLTEMFINDRNLCKLDSTVIAFTESSKINAGRGQAFTTKKLNGICSTYHQLARTRGKSRSKPPLAAYPPAILGFSFASGRIHWDPAFASGKRCANYRPIAAENPALWRVDHTIGCAPITISRPFLRWPRRKNKTQNDVSKLNITESI